MSQSVPADELRTSDIHSTSESGRTAPCRRMKALRRVLDVLGLKHEHVAVAFLGHSNGQYFSKQLTGKKPPLSDEDERRLPIEVRELWALGWCCHLEAPWPMPITAAFREGDR